MAKAGDIMHRGAECIGEDETLEMAARKMRDMRVGSLPICGKDQRLHGILTDRDIVIRCIADGGDPRTTTARTWLRAPRSGSTSRPPRTTCYG